MASRRHQRRRRIGSGRSILLWALGLALAVAAPLMYLTGSLDGGGNSETVAYEVELPGDALHGGVTGTQGGV